MFEKKQLYDDSEARKGWGLGMQNLKPCEMDRKEHLRSCRFLKFLASLVDGLVSIFLLLAFARSGLGESRCSRDVVTSDSEVSFLGFKVLISKWKSEVQLAKSQDLAFIWSFPSCCDRYFPTGNWMLCFVKVKEFVSVSWWVHHNAIWCVLFNSVISFIQTTTYCLLT